MLRKVLIGVLSVLLGLAGIFVLLLVFSGRDKAGVGAEGNAGPGRAFPLQGAEHRAAPGFRYSSFPPTSGPHRAVPIPGDGAHFTADSLLSALEAGDIVLLFPPGPAPAALRGVQATVAGGPSTPALRADGQAVILGTYRGTGPGVVALAWGHLLLARSAAEPTLAPFADFWLGAGAPAAK